MQDEAIHALENGLVLFFPELPFTLASHEMDFLSPEMTDPKSKNISYDKKKDSLGGSTCQGVKAEELKEMVKRYSTYSCDLVEKLFPHYSATIMPGRTSFRPVEIAGRKSSRKKDDTLLHVDAFPSTPVKGKRIMRVFTNVNPHGKSRVWRLGEPFSDVVSKLSPRLSHPFPGVAHLMKALRITKDYRTLYDHYMLQLHDHMKMDGHYQQTVPQQVFHFPPGASWIVYTDQVSHAAMAGQHVFEQTFYLPAEGNKFLETSPLKVLESHFKRKLT
jgi:hypothetical protein